MATVGDNSMAASGEIPRPPTGRAKRPLTAAENVGTKPDPWPRFHPRIGPVHEYDLLRGSKQDDHDVDQDHGDVLIIKYTRHVRPDKVQP